MPCRTLCSLWPIPMESLKILDCIERKKLLGPLLEPVVVEGQIGRTVIGYLTTFLYFASNAVWLKFPSASRCAASGLPLIANRPQVNCISDSLARR